MILWWKTRRKKILRKLGRRFSKKYNFKRLLQTTPNLSKLYNEHEDAVNSIKPVKHVQLISLENIRAFSAEDSAINANTTCKIEIYGPGGGKWPCRIKYAEQILDVNHNGYSAWVVRIRQSSSTDATVDVLHYKKPCVTLYYPVRWDAPKNHCPISNPNKLTRIDENKFVSYFLIGEDCDKPTDLRTCSIIPSGGGDTWNSTFYDREIAYLYAESLQTQIDKMEWRKF